MRAEFGDFPDDALYRLAASQERDSILCLHQPDILLHATSQTRKIEGGVSLLSWLPGNPDIIAIDTDFKRRRVVGPSIASAPAAQGEARMVPVTGEDAFLGAPFA